MATKKYNGEGNTEGLSAQAYLTQLEGTTPTYQQSDALMNAQNAVANQEAAKPGAYQSAYSNQIDSTLNSILNRDKFSYDFNADPIYQQYKNQYVRQGQQAMQDTMGQAAALTGGYGNSYAASAGNQAYNEYLTKLNNVIPELQNGAYTRYQAEGNDMYNQLGALQGQDKDEYDRYRDEMKDYYDVLDYLYQKSSKLQDIDLATYQQLLAQYNKERTYYAALAAKEGKAGTAQAITQQTDAKPSKPTHAAQMKPEGLKKR